MGWGWDIMSPDQPCHLTLLCPQQPLPPELRSLQYHTMPIMDLPHPLLCHWHEPLPPTLKEPSL